MGYYINPENCTKEEWLVSNGKRVTGKQSIEAHSKEGNTVVILVDNGWMTAAGVAFSQPEYEAFFSPEDSRPKKQFVVPISSLSNDSGLSNNVLSRLFADTKGVTALEYGIIAGVFGLVLIGIFSKFSVHLSTLFSIIGKSI